MTILEALKSLSNYPMPARAFTRIAAGRALDLTTETTLETFASKNFRLAEADVLTWLTKAPTVTENRTGYSFSPEEKERFRIEASNIYGELGEADRVYGYKGEDL